MHEYINSICTAIPF